MPTQEEIKAVIDILKKEYPLRLFPTNREKDPYYVLISCLLSLRTRDPVTEVASKKLFMLAKTPQEMITLPDEEIRKAIYPVGFYNNKTRIIKEVSRTLLEKYNGKVPDTLEELLKLKGVGRKTAQIVLVHGFNIPALPVDTHVHRVPNRMRWVNTKTPEETEFALREFLPKEYWLEFNELFVKHGQNVCKPIVPQCYKCAIIRYCGFPNKNLRKNF